MKTTEKLHQIHLNEWASRFSDQKASGPTVKQWCEQNNLYPYLQLLVTCS